MLDYVAMKNFGCFDEHGYVIKFNKLNVIMGENNSGKSTVFKAVNFLRMLPERGTNNWETPFYSLRDINEALYGHDTTRILELGLGYKLDNSMYEAKLKISPNYAFDHKFFKDGQHVSSLADEVFQRIKIKIWYFMPNRATTPYETQVNWTEVGIQSISPSGRDIAPYLLGRWTDRDPNWDEAEKWLKKIDNQMTLLKTPVISGNVRVATQRNDGKTDASINLTLQGTGIQNAATIISGIFFSPPNATIIIEEPENFLHPRTIEIIVDLFNYAVNTLGKQIIITTHSWDILRAYISDIGAGERRGEPHVRANPNDFKLITFKNKLGTDKIGEYDLKTKTFTQVINDFKTLWG